MSSFTTTVVYPVPTAWVSNAVAQAAASTGMQTQDCTPAYVKCHTGMTLMSYPVTIEIQVAGSDGAARLDVKAHNFGWGPIQTGACRDKAQQLLYATSMVLQAWSRQAAMIPPAAPNA